MAINENKYNFYKLNTHEELSKVNLIELGSSECIHELQLRKTW